mgnify:CR=1 FL=1
MFVSDVMVAALYADVMCFKEHVGMAGSSWRLKFIAGTLNQLPQRIPKIDGVHKAAVDFACMADATFIQPFGNLAVRGFGHGKCQVVEVADSFRIASGIGLPVLIGEDGD